MSPAPAPDTVYKVRSGHRTGKWDVGQGSQPWPPVQKPYKVGTVSGRPPPCVSWRAEKAASRREKEADAQRSRQGRGFLSTQPFRASARCCSPTCKTSSEAAFSARTFLTTPQAGTPLCLCVTPSFLTNPIKVGFCFPHRLHSCKWFSESVSHKKCFSLLCLKHGFTGENPKADCC